MSPIAFYYLLFAAVFIYFFGGMTHKIIADGFAEKISIVASFNIIEWTEL